MMKLSCVPPHGRPCEGDARGTLEIQPHSGLGHSNLETPATKQKLLSTPRNPFAPTESRSIYGRGWCVSHNPSQRIFRLRTTRESDGVQYGFNIRHPQSAPPSTIRCNGTFPFQVSAVDGSHTIDTSRSGFFDDQHQTLRHCQFHRRIPRSRSTCGLVNPIHARSQPPPQLIRCDFRSAFTR
jgi:hypothetical protein